MKIARSAGFVTSDHRKRGLPFMIISEVILLAKPYDTMQKLQFVSKMFGS